MIVSHLGFGADFDNLWGSVRSKALEVSRSCSNPSSATVTLCKLLNFSEPLHENKSHSNLFQVWQEGNKNTEMTVPDTCQWRWQQMALLIVLFWPKLKCIFIPMNPSHQWVEWLLSSHWALESGTGSSSRLFSAPIAMHDAGRRSQVLFDWSEWLWPARRTRVTDERLGGDFASCESFSI